MVGKLLELALRAAPYAARLGSGAWRGAKSTAGWAYQKPGQALMLGGLGYTGLSSLPDLYKYVMRKYGADTAPEGTGQDLKAISVQKPGILGMGLGYGGTPTTTETETPAPAVATPAALTPPPEQDTGWLGSANKFLSSDAAQVLGEVLMGLGDPTGKTFQALAAKTAERRQKESETDAVADLLLQRGLAKTPEQARTLAKVPGIAAQLVPDEAKQLDIAIKKQQLKDLEVKAEEREEEKKYQAFKVVEDFRLFSNQIDDVKGMLERNVSLGGWGVLFQDVPGSEQRGLKGLIETLKGANFLNAINSLRTSRGLGIGPLSNQESAHLIASLGSLDMGQPTAQFYKTLDIIQGYIGRLAAFKASTYDKTIDQSAITRGASAPLSEDYQAHFDELKGSREDLANLSANNWENYLTRLTKGSSQVPVFDTQEEGQRYLEQNPHGKFRLRGQSQEYQLTDESKQSILNR